MGQWHPLSNTFRYNISFDYGCDQAIFDNDLRWDIAVKQVLHYVLKCNYNERLTIKFPESVDSMAEETYKDYDLQHAMNSFTLIKKWKGIVL